MRSRFLLVVAVAIFWALVPSILSAQTPLPFDELGAGPKAPAMGQAYTAIANDSSAAYYNPAGLARIPSPFSMTFEYNYCKPRLHESFDTPPERSRYLGPLKTDPNEGFQEHGFYVGITTNLANVEALKNVIIANRIGFGLALFLNTSVANSFQNPQTPQDPYVLRYNQGWALTAIAISFSARITDWFSVGIGVLPRIDAEQDSRNSWIVLNAPENDPTRGFRLDLKQETHLSSIILGGILVSPPWEQLRDRISLGVNYRGQVDGYYGSGPESTNVILQFPTRKPFVIARDPGGMAVDYIGFTPQQIAVGLAGKPIDNLLLSFDAVWKDWSAFNFFWHLPPFAVDPATGQQVNVPFDDVWVWRFGAQYILEPHWKGKYPSRFRQFAFRFGYYREDTPVPYAWNGHPVLNMSGPMNILDSNQNVFSCGLGVLYGPEWATSVELDLFFQAHVFEKNYIANNLDPLYSGITFSGEVYNAGAALSVTF